jgi:hypothetical protein
MFSTEVQHDWKPEDPCCVIGQPLKEAWVVDRIITGSTGGWSKWCAGNPSGPLTRMAVSEDD